MAAAMVAKINAAMRRDDIAVQMTELNICAVELLSSGCVRLPRELKALYDEHFGQLRAFQVAEHIKKNIQRFCTLEGKTPQDLFILIGCLMKWFQITHGLPSAPTDDEERLRVLTLERCVEMQRAEYIDLIGRICDGTDLGKSFASIWLLVEDQRFVMHRHRDLPEQQTDPEGTDYKTPTEQMQVFLQRAKDLTGDAEKTNQLKMVLLSMMARDFTTRWNMGYIKDIDTTGEDRMAEVMKVIIPKLVQDRMTLKGVGKGK